MVLFKALWFGEKGLSIGYVLSGSIWVRLCQRRPLVGRQGHVMGAGLAFKWTVQKAKGILPACSIELACTAWNVPIREWLRLYCLLTQYNRKRC